MYTSILLLLLIENDEEALDIVSELFFDNKKLYLKDFEKQCFSISLIYDNKTLILGYKFIHLKRLVSTMDFYNNYLSVSKEILFNSKNYDSELLPLEKYLLACTLNSLDTQ